MAHIEAIATVVGGVLVGVLAAGIAVLIAFVISKYRRELFRDK